MPRYTFLFDKFDRKKKTVSPAYASFDADDTVDLYSVAHWLAMELPKKDQALIRCIALKDADESTIGKLLSSCCCIKDILPNLELEQPQPLYINPSVCFEEFAYSLFGIQKLPATPADIARRVRVLVEMRKRCFAFETGDGKSVGVIVYDPQQQNELEVQFGILADMENLRLYTNGIGRIPADAFTNEGNASVWIKKISHNIEKMYGKQLFLYSIPENQKK